MRRDFHEPWEPEDVFASQEAADRRAKIESARAEHEAFEKHEAELAAERKETARLFSLGANERLRLAEYDLHGVTPPVLNGVPTKSSLPLLRSLGWTIEEIDGKRTLIQPAARNRKTREDYAAESLKDGF
ncbi:hypothetical protein [Bradyrhizobium sp.]